MSRCACFVGWRGLIRRLLQRRPFVSVPVDMLLLRRIIVPWPGLRGSVCGRFDSDAGSGCVPGRFDSDTGGGCVFGHCIRDGGGCGDGTRRRPQNAHGRGRMQLCK
jgi:hypothetical protein